MIQNIRSLKRTLLAGLVLSMGSAGLAHAAPFTFNCPTGGDGAGWSVVTGGDMNGDGVDDIAMSAPCAFVGKGLRGKPGAGEVLVVSGVTGKRILRRRGGQANEYLGAGMAFLPDINGDGKDEIIIGSPGYDLSPSQAPEPGSGPVGNAGKIVVVNSKNKRVRRIFGTQSEGGFGDTVASVEDVDGDGVADIVVGARNERDVPLRTIRPGRVHLYSTRTRELIGMEVGVKKNDEFGIAISAAADVDGDTMVDIIIGAPNRNSGGADASGVVSIFRGDFADTLPTLDILGAKNDRIGRAIADAGDRNADGQNEFIIGAYTSRNTGIKEAGEVQVYDGNGQLIFSASDEDPEEKAFFGQAVANVSDLNDDGLDDFAVGAPGADGADEDGLVVDAGRAVVINGADGTPLWSITHDVDEAMLGSSVSGAPDFDDDGTPDVVIGATGDLFLGRRGAGTVRIHSGVDGTVLRTYGGRHGLETRLYSAGSGELNGYKPNGDLNKPRAAISISGNGSVAVVDDSGVPKPGEVLLAVGDGHDGRDGEVEIYDAGANDLLIASFDALEDAEPVTPEGANVSGGVNVAAGRTGADDANERIVAVQADSSRGDVLVRVFTRLFDEQTGWVLIEQWGAFTELDGFEISDTVTLPIDATGGTVAVGDVLTGPREEVIVSTEDGLPLVRVFDDDGNKLQEWLAYSPNEIGGGVQLCVSDFDDQGSHEIVTVPSNGPPIIQVFTGEGQRVQVPFSDDLISIVPEVPAGFMGGGRACAVDIDLDGSQEIVFVPGEGAAPIVQAFELDGTPVEGFVPFEVSGPAFAVTDSFVRR